jgi:predicted RNA binding protein YcfA (HicA-like mRNA interferase family)
VVVSNAAKLIAKMRRNPRDWRIEDLKVVADRLGIDHDRHGTSHVVFRHAKAGRLSVPADRPIKPVCVRLFVNLVDRAGHQDED